MHGLLYKILVTIEIHKQIVLEYYAIGERLYEKDPNDNSTGRDRRR